MGTGFNQVVTISGGPGATSVQHIDYDPVTHMLTLVKANGTTSPVLLKDSHLESAVINGNKMTFSIGDMSHGLVDTVIDLDITDLKNAVFATQVETDAGVLSDVVISPAMLKAWLTNEVRANQPTVANAGKLVPLDANGTIAPKYIPHISMTNVHVKPDKAALDALLIGGGLLMGDTGIDLSGNKTYIYDGAGWQELLTPTTGVTSVAGKSGIVTLDLDDIAESASKQHLAPGNVLNDVLFWNPSAGTHGAWESKAPASLEIAGKAFAGNTVYDVGDIVSHGNNSYIRKIAGSEASFDITKWQVTDTAGRLHSDASRYEVGDIVTYQGQVYSNLSKITSPKPWDPLDWTLISFSASTMIVDDLVTGGTNVALSAEQGKILNNKLAIADWNIDSTTLPGSIDPGRIINKPLVKDDFSGGTTDLLSAEQGKVLQNTKVGSVTSGKEKRIPDMVEMTQLDYDLLGSNRPNKLYIIVN